MMKGDHLNYYRYDGRGIQGRPEDVVKCMKSVTVEDVFAAISAALEAGAR